MLVLGIMSGTSIDGIDYALCEIRPSAVRLVELWSREFPATLRKRLHVAAGGVASTYELAQLHHDLGRLYAAQAQKLKAGAALVGLHGQTVFHNPDRRAPATLQIGEPSYLAEALRLPVVSNFRAADIAAGGQGAPIATAFHRVVFAVRGEHVCVNNLGGISNVTSLHWRNGKAARVVAFDTGPANVLIDLAMRTLSDGRIICDRNGAWAGRGKIDQELLHSWLKHRYFKASPPKSTGRELFGEPFWNKASAQAHSRRLSNYDLLATLTEFTARSIALSYKLHLPDAPSRVVLAGGGARNPVLVRAIEQALREQGDTKVLTSESLGWPAQAIEPAAFALLAYYRWREIPADFAGTTGALRKAVCGQLALPSSR